LLGLAGRGKVLSMNVRGFAVVLAGLYGGLLASGQTGPTQQDIEARLQGPFVLLRGMWDCNSLHFDEQGNLMGSCDAGSLSLSAVIVKSVRLNDRKLEIKGDRAGLEFARGPTADSPETVSAVPVDRITINIARDWQHPDALGAAVAKVFSPGFDDAFADQAPVYWQRWLRHEIHPNFRIMSAPVGVFQLERANAAQQGVTPPRLLHVINPSFTDEARRRKFQGMVILGLIVDASGEPRDVYIVHPVGMGLDEMAVAAARHYDFTPAARNGEPVPVMINIEVNFRIY
jgi:TonB family protein